ncbi:hypothetical protein BXZ70DRAFT_932959 [Cristinia sonorae]|uniref:Uncharacterized protein n=1 Tax=Cristinia sonorae TaxID=1940300 RepID=A0A8K0UPZ3_9AGAR|nr:hypothetical protein BXZ70DRAFT_932959 [Cristinia sonorae]
MLRVCNSYVAPIPNVPRLQWNPPLAAIIGSRLFRFNRNTTIVCGALTGILAGYQFTQGFLSSNLAHWEAEQAILNPSHQVLDDTPT